MLHEYYFIQSKAKWTQRKWRSTRKLYKRNRFLCFYLLACHVFIEGHSKDMQDNVSYILSYYHRLCVRHTIPKLIAFTLFSVYEQQFSVAGVKEDLEDEMQQRVAVDEKQAPNEKDNSGVTIFSQTSSQETYPQSLPEKVTSVPSTPTFPIK